ncbi:hypothetical protein NM688_g3970 [Phlebia brevispora]|uniref:Uncharacterized protein n=1 Tax=Phlebia brevispora TaxID=194682 RepID=A0ACC1T486_9APHY|nr:hypothetical protein NM688_g3970 [Phlebia brevispora]
MPRHGEHSHLAAVRKRAYTKDIMPGNSQVPTADDVHAHAPIRLLDRTLGTVVFYIQQLMEQDAQYESGAVEDSRQVPSVVRGKSVQRYWLCRVSRTIEDKLRLRVSIQTVKRDLYADLRGDVGGVVVVKYVRASYARSLMPPGPPGIPILGNALQMPKDQAFRPFAEWGKEYGPVYSLNVAGKPILVVNSLKVARELFEGRSGIYADRPRMILASDVLCGGLSIAFMPYGSTWRKHRRAIHEAMNIRDVAAYGALQEREALNLVAHLLEAPDEWRRYCSRTTAAGVISIIYGSALTRRNLDHIIENIWELVESSSRLAGKEMHLVEFFPALMRVPNWLARWKRDTQVLFAGFSKMFVGFMQDTAAQVQMDKDDETSFAEHLIKAGDKFGLSPLESAWLPGVMITAGTDTTSGMLSVFVLMMVLYPDVMRRAQAELDAVVGRERLPTLADEDSLPYVAAIVRELLRMWPVAPLGLPKATSEDDWYNGYFIPKKLVRIQARLSLQTYGKYTSSISRLEHLQTRYSRAMGRNPEDFPDPNTFRPERYLDDENGTNISRRTKLQRPFAFGFGRRLCPGRNVAMRTLFIDIACMLWALEFHPIKDEHGKPVLPSQTECVDDGLTTTPAPFRCSIQPRSRDVKEVLESARRGMKMQ